MKYFTTLTSQVWIFRLMHYSRQLLVYLSLNLASSMAQQPVGAGPCRNPAMLRIALMKAESLNVEASLITCLSLSELKRSHEYEVD